MNNAEPTVNAAAMSSDSSTEIPGIGSANCMSIGTRLAEFEITGVVGEGGFGIVYLAFDHSLQRTVAIKEYMPAAMAARTADHGVAVRSKRHQDAFDAGLRSFINEGRLLAQFDHSALIKVYRFWEQHKTAYMVMRYYEGQTFKNIVRHDPGIVTEAWLKRILKPLLEALDVLYRIQILHRDISPDNIMIQANGDAVLLDFGAARQIIGDMTRSLTVILKPGYAPVEQYADDDSMKQGAWTDIYALSAVVYSAIAKKSPPTSVARMLNDPIKPLQGGDHAGFSSEFLAAIDKGLAVRPEDRPQSIEEFSRLLGIDDHAKHVPTTTANQAADGLFAPTKTPARSIWPLAVSGIVLIIGAGGYWLASQRDTAFAKPAALEEEIIPWEVLVKNPSTTASVPEAAKANGKPADLVLPKAPAVKPKAASASAKSAQTTKQTDYDAMKGPIDINVTIKPWGNVFVDGIEKGVSPPLKKLTLAEGKHNIKIINSNFPDHVVEIMATRKKTANIDYDFSAGKKSLPISPIPLTISNKQQ